MADTPETDKLVKKEPESKGPEAPARDPITSRTTSSILLISALLLTGTLAWALWDEVYGQRPWKDMQASFVKRYNRYLKRLQRNGFQSEQQVRESPEYQALDQGARAAEEVVRPELQVIDRKVALIDDQLAVISDEFQDRRGRITVKNYEIESADPDDKAEMRRELQQMKVQKARFEMPSESGRREQREYDYAQLEGLYNDLKREKASLLTERGDKLKPVSDLRRQRDEYLKNNVAGVTEDTVNKLRAKNENFEVKMRQINIQGDQVVDRCETCHLGTRESIEIDAGDMMSAGRRNNPDPLAKAFVSHPSKELLKIHDPEKFGCASCHGGNGRATTNVVKGHGRHRFWLHPLYERENMEAGCQQCHMQDRVLVGASILNKGKDLFTERGCVGCHRYEGFDRETDSLATARQEIKQLEEQVAANNREALMVQAKRDEPGISDEENQQLLARIEALTVTSSQIESRVDQLNIQSRYLMQDQKKVGPNLKDVRIKLVKEWIPVWLQDPQAFRPGTKMPTYWYLSGKEGISVPPARQDEERKAIAAYLWQSAFDGRLPQQPAGNAATGKQLFETRGCLACHSIGEGESVIGADFAANLQKVGQKANYEYLVRWVHNPRERISPYCPKERKDLTPADYAAKNLPYVFDANHSKCPNDGAELQIQNMTVMPNFRLSDQDSRDIATYLKSLSPPATYPDASFMDDPNLKAKGGELIKTYGCAGCHEIRGFEEEQRIGKELTTEGATPLERLDFALMTHEAEDGHDPLNLHPEKKNQSWYNHKGFFEHKIEDPSIYDRGKEKEPQDHLRMPDPFMKDDWRVALTTFLLGSKGDEGANVPKSFYYTPNSLQKDIQDGWWVIKKYNCMGCHQIQVGQERPSITRLPWYEEAGELGKRQWPPGLLTEGARVDPNWLLRFLRDPSLSGLSEEELTATAHGTAAGATRPATRSTTAAGAAGTTTAQPGAANARPGAAPNATTAQLQPAAPSSGQASPPAAGGPAPTLPPQPGENTNGLRRNLAPRMPTFNFSPNELRILVRFFMAYASQQEPYIKEPVVPLTPEETSVARAFFSSGTQPCLSCHLTGDPTHDQTAYAPNFLDAAQRLKPAWTLRWILDPPKIWPDTTMPGGLFAWRDGRWVPTASMSPEAESYQGDHAQLIMRYILQMTESEQNTLAALGRAAQSRPATAAPPAASPPPPVASAHGRPKNAPTAAAVRPSRERRAARSGARRGGKSQVSRARSPSRGRARAPGVAAFRNAGRGGFSP